MRAFTILATSVAAFMVQGCASAQTPECPDGSLRLDFIQVQTLAPETDLTARIHGVIETPSSGYTYRLTIGEMREGRVSGQLELFQENPDMMSLMVITPVTIDDTVKLPINSNELFVDVTKNFNWGAEYFQAKFDGQKSICMAAEMYKN